MFNVSFKSDNYKHNLAHEIHTQTTLCNRGFFVILRFVHSVGQKHTHKLNNTNEEEIRFCRDRTERHSGIQNERAFHKLDVSFNQDSVAIQIVPVFGIAGNAGIESEIFIWIGINTFAIR